MLSEYSFLRHSKSFYSDFLIFSVTKCFFSDSLGNTYIVPGSYIQGWSCHSENPMGSLGRLISQLQRKKILELQCGKQANWRSLVMLILRKQDHTRSMSTIRQVIFLYISKLNIYVYMTQQKAQSWQQTKLKISNQYYRTLQSMQFQVFQNERSLTSVLRGGTIAQKFRSQLLNLIV